VVDIGWYRPRIALRAKVTNANAILEWLRPIPRAPYAATARFGGPACDFSRDACRVVIEEQTATSATECRARLGFLVGRRHALVASGARFVLCEGASVVAEGCVL
jgi:hypothetical protein